MNFVPLLVLLGLLAVTVLALFVWRKALSAGEDDNLHVLDGGAVQKSAQQISLAQKLELIDKWGKIMTIVTVLFGLILAGLYAWQSWVQNGKLGA